MLYGTLSHAKQACWKIECKKNNMRDGELFDDLEKYLRLVGKLNYLMVIRPNICLLSQHCKSINVFSNSSPLGSIGEDSMLLKGSSKPRNTT